MKENPKPLFSLFVVTKNHINIVVNLVEAQEKSIQLAYFIFLRDFFNKKIDNVLMKNNKKEIFKLLDNIDNNGDNK